MTGRPLDSTPPLCSPLASQPRFLFLGMVGKVLDMGFTIANPEGVSTGVHRRLSKNAALVSTVWFVLGFIAGLEPGTRPPPLYMDMDMVRRS